MTTTHGGARKGAGRHTLPESLRRIKITARLRSDEIQFLKSLAPSLSAAIRKLIESARRT